MSESATECSRGTKQSAMLDLLGQFALACGFCCFGLVSLAIVGLIFDWPPRLLLADLLPGARFHYAWPRPNREFELLLPGLQLLTLFLWTRLLSAFGSKVLLALPALMVLAIWLLVTLFLLDHLATDVTSALFAGGMLLVAQRAVHTGRRRILRLESRGYWPCFFRSWLWLGLLVSLVGPFVTYFGLMPLPVAWLGMLSDAAQGRWDELRMLGLLVLPQAMALGLCAGAVAAGAALLRRGRREFLLCLTVTLLTGEIFFLWPSLCALLASLICILTDSLCHYSCGPLGVWQFLGFWKGLS